MLSRGFSLGIYVWRVPLCLFGRPCPGTPLLAWNRRRERDKRPSNRATLACNFGKETGTFWRNSQKSRRRARISFITVTCFKAQKKVASPPRIRVTSPWMLGSPRLLTPKGCSSPAKHKTLGAHSCQVYPEIFTAAILDSSPTSPKQPPFAC